MMEQWSDGAILSPLIAGHARDVRHVRAVVDIHRDNVSRVDVNLSICARDRGQDLGGDTDGPAG